MSDQDPAVYRLHVQATKRWSPRQRSGSAPVIGRMYTTIPGRIMQMAMQTLACQYFQC